MKRIIPLLAVFLSPVLLVSGQTQQGSESGLFRQEGIASWYGDEFAGRPTASGEIFNPALLTAAHPTLPFGTLIKVTNIHNNRQVMVRVNDRGPFVSSRILDVSRAAAEQLDMIATGTAPVVLEAQVSLSLVPTQPAAGSEASSPSPPQPSPPVVLLIPEPQPQVQAPAAGPKIPAAEPPPVQAPAPNPPPETQGPASPAASNSGQSYPPAGPAPEGYDYSSPIPLTATVIPGIPPTGTGKRYRIQVGSYKAPRYALDAFDKLKNLGLTPAYERYGEFYRVVLSGIRPEEVPALADQLGTAGFLEVLIREEGPRP
ncbi:MAG: septal ring lytic transglycosylase RlpA family protein [Spirochaetaceae bacterium]|jgi:rare lipoprotein A|nr:septal ring lytic transglycosylase RlpA family protein [Spirochaetaceae bacterium]